MFAGQRLPTMPVQHRLGLEVPTTPGGCPADNTKLCPDESSGVNLNGNHCHFQSINVLRAKAPPNDSAPE